MQVKKHNQIISILISIRPNDGLIEIETGQNMLSFI